MARKERVWFVGASYHIMCRGNRRGDLFRCEEDYKIYLSIIAQTMNRYPFSLISYCLMTNHVHLQIETKETAIWYIMKLINQNYSFYFNKKYNLIGHLYQGPYHANLIEDDAYTLHISRYIHLNPVKARMVKRPLDYKWSSYGVYMGIRKDELIAEDRILDYFLNQSRELYRDYVESMIQVSGEEIKVKAESEPKQESKNKKDK